MSAIWKSVSGHLVCKWSDVAERRRSEAIWMQEICGVEGSYLEPGPDFSAHSPFGGPSWFDPQYRVPR